MLIRMAPTHVRFGSFEVFFYRKQHDHLKTLADYVISGYFPHLNDDSDRYARFLAEIARKTGIMIAHWQAVGWAHGVMNTDNMSVLGLTLDYGPYGFMDDFTPGFIPNHSDHHGRYSFQNQPDIGYWNVRAMAQALSPLLEDADVHGAPELYEETMFNTYSALMQAKLGLQETHEGDDNFDETCWRRCTAIMWTTQISSEPLGILSRMIPARIQRYASNFLIAKDLIGGLKDIGPD